MTWLSWVGWVKKDALLHQSVAIGRYFSTGLSQRLQLDSWSMWNFSVETLRLASALLYTVCLHFGSF